MTPECPNCNVELSFQGIDDEYYEDDKFINTCSGECPECNKKFSWFELYQFVRFADLREEEE